VVDTLLVVDAVLSCVDELTSGDVALILVDLIGGNVVETVVGSGTETAVTTIEDVSTGREKLELLLLAASTIVLATAEVSGSELTSLNTSTDSTMTDPWLKPVITVRLKLDPY